MKSCRSTTHTRAGPEQLGVCVQLLPLMWLALLSLTLSLLAVLKWLLVNRVKATSYQKYSWAFQTKALNAAVQVCILLTAHEQQPISQSTVPNQWTSRHSQEEQAHLKPSRPHNALKKRYLLC